MKSVGSRLTFLPFFRSKYLRTSAASPCYCNNHARWKPTPGLADFAAGWGGARLELGVPDHASRIRDVVLVRHIFSSGNPRGPEIWDGEGMGRGWKWGDQFTSNLGPGWTGSYHTKEGFQVSKREWKGSKGESKWGVKSKGIAS